jgi:glycosyltransferase involved in cell wall biosynthesis
MNVLHLVKYYHPSKGGMESVVENIITGVKKLNDKIEFSVYCSNHIKNINSINFIHNKSIIYKESTLFYYKSQPLTFYYSKLNKLLKSTDIVHLHFPFPNVEIGLILNYNTIKRKSLIITWHANIENSRWKIFSKVYLFFIDILLKRSCQIVVTSPQLLINSRILKKYKNKICVIPLTYNEEKFPKIHKGLTFPGKDQFILLFVGKLRKYKGLEYLFKAIETIDLKLFIVGEGEYYEELEKYVQLKKLYNKIIFFRNVSDSDLINMYLSSHLFVLPSISEAEAFGVVQLEAMSFGLPVINTNLNSGVPFVSINDLTGFTVQPKSFEQLREAIIAITKNPELYEKFSKNAIHRSMEFSKKKMSTSYLNLYNQFIH